MKYPAGHLNILTSQTKIFLVLLKRMYLKLKLVDSLAKAFKFAFKTYLLPLNIFRLHQLLFAHQVVQFLLNLFLLSFHHIHLSVLLIELSFDCGMLCFTLHFPSVLFVKSRLTWHLGYSPRRSLG